MKQKIALVIIIVGLALAGFGCATAPRQSPLTVSQVVAMSQAGVPADQIIERMRESGAYYPLSASDLARLRGEGVPDAVINYMQRTYVAEARRRQEYEDWTWYPDTAEEYLYGGPPPYGWPWP